MIANLTVIQRTRMSDDKKGLAMSWTVSGEICRELIRAAELPRCPLLLRTVLLLMLHHVLRCLLLRLSKLIQHLLVKL